MESEERARRADEEKMKGKERIPVARPAEAVHFVVHDCDKTHAQAQAGARRWSSTNWYVVRSRAVSREKADTWDGTYYLCDSDGGCVS